MKDLLTILQGDVLDRLRELPDESVQCIVTSPPYYGQRDYGVAGQIGMESCPQKYVEKMVEVFADGFRVLRDDGVLFLNLGDCYCSQGGIHDGREDNQPGVGAKRMWRNGSGRADGIVDERGQRNRNGNSAPGLKPKDLIGIPWMLAFALRDAGWYLRSCNIWAKPNGMPESVKDRPVVAHEYVFQLTRSERYYFDYDAVRLPAMDSSIQRLAQHIDAQHGSERANAGAKVNGTMKAVTRKTDKQRGHSRRHDGFNDRWDQMEKDEQQAGGAALRSVWWIPPAQSKESHFAVMPERLASLCILASTRPGDTVMDPFAGSGTVGKVALELGRKAVLIELNPEYVKIIEKRCRVTPGLALH